MTLIFLVLFSISGCYRNSFANTEYENEVCSKGAEIKIEKKLGAYKVRVFHEQGIGDYYDLGTDGEGKYEFETLIGKGKQLIVRKWSGGAHCCTTLFIFDLAKSFKEIAEIYSGNYDPELIDLDYDGIPEIRLEDDVLAYLYSSFASSAHGAVILKYKNGRYEVSSDLMRRPVPSQHLLQVTSRHWRKLLVSERGPEWPPPQLNAWNALGHRL